ncbi:hypothetical protein ES705_34383 [subsurface metagenome]
MMGFLGIPLELGTVTFASVILGLVVDDTIHFFYRFRYELSRQRKPEEAVRVTVRSIGYSMVITSVTLAVGFSILGLAHVKSIIWFGVLICIAISMALIADLIISPALIVIQKSKLTLIQNP